jgi:hypothetical protein
MEKSDKQTDVSYPENGVNPLQTLKSHKKLKTIGVINELSTGNRNLLDALGVLFSIRFEERDIGNDSGIDAWFVNKTDIKTINKILPGTRPCYTTIHSEELIPCGQSQKIEFSKSQALPSLLRGRQIKTDEAVKLMALPPELKNLEIIASKAGYPVWALQESENCQHHYVATTTPELNDNEPLFRFFNGRQFLHLLPFLLFLRSLTEDRRWEPPPLQACFMFDDPNLHWPTYGFIKYSEMVQHAKMFRYHTSIATIPLDTWFVHTPTASIFKENRQEISLLIHGNDHISKELARLHSDDERNLILWQALKRIEDFERGSGVEVSRVMAPPHGACNERFLAGLSNLGFEAACISRGSLHSYNSNAKWLSTLGMSPSDIIEGLTVFPRFPLSKSCHNSILIAALLHQPIIPVGHHQDVSAGLGILDDLSAFINSMGDINWANMTGISRSNFARMISGRTLQVKMFAKRIEVNVFEGIDSIRVERSWLEEVDSEPLTWRALEDSAEWKQHRLDEIIPVSPGQKIEIISNPTSCQAMNNSQVRKLRIWPMVRRQLTEVRDRVAPALNRFSRGPDSDKRK